MKGAIGGQYSAKAFRMNGGEGGIRTHGGRKTSTVFETARFNHSRTSPQESYFLYYLERGGLQDGVAGGAARGEGPLPQKMGTAVTDFSFVEVLRF